jgi:hypothetical protein
MAQSANGEPLPRREERFLSPPAHRIALPPSVSPLRTRPKTYRAIVQLLADSGARFEKIAKLHRVSTHTVRAIRAREAVAIAERKQRLMSIFANAAEISAERMEELAGQAGLRDAGTTAGIAIDKFIALTADPTIHLEHIHKHVHAHFDAKQAFDELIRLTRKIAGEAPEALNETGDASQRGENAAQKAG